MIDQAVYEAVRKGTLVVAASGNDGDAGNPLGYPASLPHVLTVGASDQGNAVAAFSSRSRFVDLVAPGENVPIAVVYDPPRSGVVANDWYLDGNGTSFSSPLVAGAAAWVWTVRPELDATQLFEVMRRSATDIGAPGRDDAAGFGLLNVPAALAYPAPVRDPFEPNDDIEFVRPGGLYDNSIPPLTTPTKRVANLQARLDRAEDPRDVYRVWLPKNGRLTATLTADTNVDLSLWKKGTVSVTERIVGSGPDRAGDGARPVRAVDVHEQGPGAVCIPRGGLPDGGRRGDVSSPRLIAAASRAGGARPTRPRTPPGGRGRRPACAHAPARRSPASPPRAHRRSRQ